MFSSAQILYLSEVLGVSPEAYRCTSARPQERLVLTAPLSSEEAALLAKILGALGGSQTWAHVQVDRPVFGELPTDRAGAAVVLLFQEGNAKSQRIGQAEWIVLPALHQMLGDGPEVQALKKKVWDELKRFKA